MLIVRRLRHLRRTLRRTTWAIILEYRQHSGTYTHAFLCNIYPYTPFPPDFSNFFFTFLGLFAPQIIHLLPVPNTEWDAHELSVVLTLGTPKTSRVT